MESANIALVQDIMKAEKLHLVHQIDALSQQRPKENFQAHHIADSVTIQSSADSGRKLNHTSGLGVTGAVTESDLEVIEQVYEVAGLPPELDMCEYACPSAFELLKARGYAGIGTISTFSCSLSNLDTEVKDTIGGIEINTTKDINTFVSTSIEGFRSGGRAESLLRLLAQSAAHRSDTTMFFARLDGEIAGAAGLACLNVGDGMTIGNMYIDSTLPASRGKGIHKALIRARLAVAKRMGCEVGIASARAGSGSARNMERAGMKCVFESTTYTRKTTA